MTRDPAPILLCTLGTSLLNGNLKPLAAAIQAGKQPADCQPLADAYAAADWPGVARELARLDPAERLCGAEINSVHSLRGRGDAVRPDCGIYLVHSDTPDGRDTAEVLAHYFRQAGHAPVQTVAITDLQDRDPRRFRTHGLRNLARQLCRLIRDHGPAACAINATGGYKAQIAVAVLIGQAIGVPVYYKHELFDEIISFPPLPVALDFEVWLRASGLLFELDREGVVPARQYEDEDWDERYESLVERETIDGADHLSLSPAGQIFHETFRERFRTGRDQVMPPPAPPGQKAAPTLKEGEGHMEQYGEAIRRYLRRVTDEVPAVTRCVTTYFNPDLPRPNRFRITRGEVEGLFCGGAWSIKFTVHSTASTDGQRAALVAALNEWAEANR